MNIQNIPICPTYLIFQRAKTTKLKLIDNAYIYSITNSLSQNLKNYARFCLINFLCFLENAAKTCTQNSLHFYYLRNVLCKCQREETLHARMSQNFKTGMRWKWENTPKSVCIRICNVQRSK